MSGDEIDATEAYAFLRVIAPKLAQLKQRLIASNDRLNSGGTDEGRLNALIDAQLALKDFLAGLAELNALVKPIDLVLEALREESVEAPDLAPPAPNFAPPAKEETVGPLPPAPRANMAASPDDWLRIGTITAAQKLIQAGMSATNAEVYLANAYATIDLTQRDGTPISVDLIKFWLGARVGGWRRKPVLKQKMGTLAAPKGPGALVEAQVRVNELSIIFKKMAAAH